MSLVTTYKEYITEKIMFRYLRDGIIPSVEDLETDLYEYMKEHKDLNLPLSKYSDFSVERGTSSSASLIQSMADIVSQDVGVITREIYSVANQAISFYDRWSTEVKRLSGKARQLEQRVDSLMLLQEDTYGFYAYVADPFTNMNFIDTSLTTAKVDLYEGNVSLDSSRSELSDGSGGALIDLSNVRNEDMGFSCVSQRPGVSKSNAPGSYLTNMFKTSGENWDSTVYSANAGEMVTELKIHMSTSFVEVSKVSFVFTAPTGTTGSTVSLQYSPDGYTWYLVDAPDPTKSLVRNVSWTFPLTSMRWIKFIFYKAAPDNTQNQYKYGINSLKLYGNVYDKTVGSTLVSNSMKAIDNTGSSVRFSMCGLDVCEVLPNDTGIDYYISASKDNETWSDWTRIVPISYEGVSYPKIINFGGAAWKDNKVEDSTMRVDDTLALDGLSQMRFTREFNNTELTGYRFKDKTFGVVNTAIPVSPNEDPDPIGNSIIVWRNIRYKNTNDYPDTLTVRGNPRGWGEEGGVYSCFFEVVDDEGLILDFGDRSCVLDGASITGVVTVPAGVHKFETVAENWFDISEGVLSLSNSVVQTEEQLKEIDPLYPHNHKLVIEGFPYANGSAYSGERVYRGTDISAEFYAKKASLFDLENNLYTYGYFSVTGVGNATNPILGIVINTDISNTDYTNELFSCKWRSGASDAHMYNYIKLKANLWTKDTGVTPSLSSYRLKLGV